MSYQEWRNKLRFGFWRPLEGQRVLGCWSKASTKPERDSNHRGRSLSTCPALSKLWSQHTWPRTICWIMMGQSPDSCVSNWRHSFTLCALAPRMTVDGMRTEWLLLGSRAKERFLPAEIHHLVLLKKKGFFSKRCGVAGEVSSGVLSLARGAVLMATLEGILNITRNQDII